MYDTPRTTPQILTMLAATPPLFADLTRDLGPAQLLAPPAPGEWSARDVLAHLRACARMWGAYIARTLNKDHPTFKAVNPTTWIKRTNYRELQFQPSLRAFSIQRAALLVVLTPLAPAAWDRAATVTGAGRRASAPSTPTPSGWPTTSKPISGRSKTSSSPCAAGPEPPRRPFKICALAGFPIKFRVLRKLQNSDFINSPKSRFG